MRIQDQLRETLVRVAILLLAAGGVWLVSDLPTEDPRVRGSLVALLFTFVCGLVLPGRFQSREARIGLLAIDLAAVGLLGCVVAEGSIPGADARLPFLSGYVVALLVATVGARVGSAVLATLAGSMVLGVAMALTVGTGYTFQPVPPAVQVVLIAATALHAATVLGSIRRQVRDEHMARLVDREITMRESAAAELVSFTQALAESSSLDDIASAALRHLQSHTDVAMRAVVLESLGDDVAVWEEAGRLGIEHVEHRRMRLQASLREAGSSFLIQRLQCHSTGVSDADVQPTCRTAVDIPVRIGGRTVGVFFLADTVHGALPPERIGALVDVARRTGDAVRRLEKLRDHENRRTALLLRQMREGVLLLGRDGQVLLANPAAREALEGCSVASEGLEPEGGETYHRLGDLSLAELADTPPGVSRRFRASYADAERGGPVQMACTAICVLDRGRRIGTLVTLTDVTEEELARNRIVQAEKMTLVGQTLAGVAHELNNPLAALIGYADLLGGQPMEPAVEKPVRQMREQAQRATRIVRNLLNFARRRNPERTPIDPREMIESTVELFAYEARMAGVEVVTETPEQVSPVLADKHALQQVLVNLVQNGLHALSGWEGSRVLTIRISEDDSGVVISVLDTGPGVPQELRTRIFESFFTTKGSTKGTGLGLALSRGIARDHGGDLMLAPDTGSGACFSMRLPRHAAGRGAMAAAAPGDSEALGARMMPEHVLVVDDEQSVRETLVAQLGTMGARVDSAGNVPEALRLVTSNKYDALIVDIRMPGSSGLDFHRELQERSPFLADRVVFITGDFVNDDLLHEALETGRLLLEKPFTMQELSAALAKTVRGPLDDEGQRLSA